jgi:hypothetical protein
MYVYLVTSAAQERDSDGTILAVKARTFGVFTSEEHANALADRYNGTVQELVLDREVGGTVLQSWVNPGYVD